jgi:hypothetical protein
MSIKLFSVLAIMLGMVTQFANAQITYNVDRAVGSGSVTGTITTDGTIGPLSTSNVLSWELTLTAPNLQGGPSVTISSLDQQQTFVTPGVVTATSTDLLFDISGGSGDGAFLLQASGFGDFYCLETEFINCTGAGIGEHIGIGSDAFVAQTSFPTGTFSFASTITPITYFVNRQLDQGFVSGTITTDGTIGVITSANIVDWDLELVAPNLAGGTIDSIDFATQAQTNISGSTTTATETELRFDISGASGVGFFLLQGTGPDNYYCIETAGAFCTGADIGEHMGRSTAGTVAQTGQPTGNFVFGTTNPVPITYCVDRQIGAGSVVGTITTDGKLGVITSGNILDWELTLTSPNLAGGPVDTISFANQFQTTIIGNTTTASSTQMFFDINGTAGEGAMLLQGGANTNYYCIETAGISCTGGGIGEHIGRGIASINAETQIPGSRFVFAEIKQNIVYNVTRRVGNGTISGFIETDGTTGPISDANIVSWELTLTSPNLAGGPSETISSDNQIQTIISSNVTTATATGLFFDISGASGDGLFLTQGASQNYWCIETALGNCTGLGVGEYIGFNANGDVDAESALPGGVFRIATNCLADLDGDGTLDFFDVSAFLAAFTTQQSSGDLNADGSWDFFDVSIFLSAFNAGCP